MVSSSRVSTALVLLVEASAFPALAQVDPGVINPGVQQRQNLPSPVLPQPQEGPLPPLFEQKQPAPQPQQPEQRLQIREVRIEGNSAVTTAELAPLLADLTQQPVGFQEIQAAVDRITAFYRSRGYLLSQALLPKQTLAGGVLKIQVLEGFIESVAVDPAPSGFSRWLQRYMAPVVGRPPITLKRLERQILLAQSIGGLQLESVLAPGQKPGGAVLTLKTQRKLASAGLSADNWVPYPLGDLRGTASAAINLYGLGRPWTFGLMGSYTWPYSNGLTNSVFTAATPLNSSGWQATGSFSYTETNSTNLNTSDAPGFLQTQGESWYGSLALSYPWLLTRRSSVFTTLQADMQNSQSDLYLDQELVQTNSIDRLRALRLRLDGAWAGLASATQAGLQLSQGLPIWGSDNGRDVGIELSNPYGSTAFFSARLTAAHQQRLGVNSPWQINLKAEGQVSGTPLPSSEQLGYGGPNLGRAFHSTYTLGDQGLLGSVELAYTVPSLKGFVLQPYLFLDGGATSLKQAAPGFPLTQSVSGYGIGLRANALAANWLSFDLGWGIPASNTVEQGRVGPGESIVFFKANLSF
ncbi:MAG: hypothetical protein RLZZ186_279 [Cyanobacteriota bacterium]